MKYDYDALSHMLESNDGLMEPVGINYVTMFVTNIKTRMLCHVQVETPKEEVDVHDTEE